MPTNSAITASLPDDSASSSFRHKRMSPQSGATSILKSDQTDCWSYFTFEPIFKSSGSVRISSSNSRAYVPFLSAFPRQTHASFLPCAQPATDRIRNPLEYSRPYVSTSNATHLAPAKYFRTRRMSRSADADTVELITRATPSQGGGSGSASNAHAKSCSNWRWRSEFPEIAIGDTIGNTGISGSRNQ